MFKKMHIFCFKIEVGTKIVFYNEGISHIFYHLALMSVLQGLCFSSHLRNCGGGGRGVGIEAQKD